MLLIVRARQASYVCEEIPGVKVMVTRTIATDLLL